MGPETVKTQAYLLITTILHQYPSRTLVIAYSSIITERIHNRESDKMCDNVNDTEGKTRHPHSPKQLRRERVIKYATESE